MRHAILILMSVIYTAAIADDSTLTSRLDSSDLDSASHVFSRVMETGDRNEWEQLHGYFIHNPERYRQILERVDRLPWKDSEGRRIRDSKRVIQFNGSHDRYIHGLSRRDFNAYVAAHLRTSMPTVESLLRMIESRHVIVPGGNGDDGQYFGERRLGIAIIKRTFPQLRTTYNWRTFNRYDADDRREVKRIASYITSQAKTLGEPSDESKSR